MKPTAIPEQLRRSVPTVATMIDGDVAWVTSWTLIIDDNWLCWLNGDTAVSQEQFGTVDTWVARVGGEYHVRAKMPVDGWRRVDWDELPSRLVPVAAIDFVGVAAP